MARCIVPDAACVTRYSGRSTSRLGEPVSGFLMVFGPLQGWSARTLLRFGALLAGQATKLLDLIAELLHLLGQGRQVRMPGCPLLLAGCFLGEQFLLPVAQRRGPLVVFGVDGGMSFAAG